MPVAPPQKNNPKTLCGACHAPAREGRPEAHAAYVSRDNGPTLTLSPSKESESFSLAVGVSHAEYSLLKR